MRVSLALIPKKRHNTMKGLNKYLRLLTGMVKNCNSFLAISVNQITLLQNVIDIKQHYYLAIQADIFLCMAIKTKGQKKISLLANVIYRQLINANSFLFLYQ